MRPVSSVRRQRDADRTRLQETERAILQARIAALERAVERKERELDAVIDQYESLIATHGEAETAVEAGAVDVDVRTDADEDAGLLARVKTALLLRG
jgi:vacuolar-type H+-ATPase subunit I/STV1